MAIRFIRTSDQPVIPRTPETFYATHSANPDIVELQDEYLMVFRGQDERGHDEIGVASCRKDHFDGRTWSLPTEPSIRVSADPEAFDSAHILDPAAILLDGMLFVYYTGHRSGWSSWNVPSHVGLAVSADGRGRQFTKHPASPVIEGMAPEVFAGDDGVHLIFQRIDDDRRISLYQCESDDGIHFDENRVRRMFGPSDSGWDGASLSTARILREDGWNYIFYGGGRRWPDYPEGIGLARSRDLVCWERYPQNPVFERGLAGSWDEGGIWFATVERIDGTYHMWYEGAGSDQSLRGTDRERASLLSRDHDYGGYGETAFSQVGHAVYKGELSSW